MTDFYKDDHRTLQDRFDSRALADTLEFATAAGLGPAADEPGLSREERDAPRQPASSTWSPHPAEGPRRWLRSMDLLADIVGL